MSPLTHEVPTAHSPESLALRLQKLPGLVLLRSGLASPQSRFSFVTADPILTFSSRGSRCEMVAATSRHELFGNPWSILRALLPRFELEAPPDLPFPTGGCFGYWGYDLKNFLEPKLRQRCPNDLGLPDCALGFYDSLVVFDHALDKCWIVTTGLEADGSRSPGRARERLVWWREMLAEGDGVARPGSEPPERAGAGPQPIGSTMSRAQFIAGVRRAISLIRAGDIYQVNLSHRLRGSWSQGAWQFFERLSGVSPAPFAAFMDFGSFQLISSSPELFLRMSGPAVTTRPIKGTRPRSADPTRDTQLAYELQSSPKELAELVMITDLLRNDLGKVCDYGTVHAPELARLERYAHVQHLVSTVEGRLRPGLTHLDALASCFPGGSITGAPKFRAMEIIEEIEPVSRGPYTGAIGYLGFNRESQLSIAIRIAICHEAQTFFHAGAGIVADSVPELEYEETLAKARGFLDALSERQDVRTGVPRGEDAP